MPHHRHLRERTAPPRRVKPSFGDSDGRAVGDVIGAVTTVGAADGKAMAVNFLMPQSYSSDEVGKTACPLLMVSPGMHHATAGSVVSGSKQAASGIVFSSTHASMGGSRGQSSGL
jgi:hypothetical protein